MTQGSAALKSSLGPTTSRPSVRTAMSRGNDNALGPCVDQRAEMANALHPDAVLSVHADGGPPSGRGFHVNYSSPALNAAQSGPSLVYAKTMRDALAGAGMTPSTYIGNDGLYGRSDLTGLNLAQYPSILVETGNMKNAHDAALMDATLFRRDQIWIVEKELRIVEGYPRIFRAFSRIVGK